MERVWHRDPVAWLSDSVAASSSAIPVTKPPSARELALSLFVVLPGLIDKRTDRLDHAIRPAQMGRVASRTVVDRATARARSQETRHALLIFTWQRQVPIKDQVCTWQRRIRVVGEFCRQDRRSSQRLRPLARLGRVEVVEEELLGVDDCAESSGAMFLMLSVSGFPGWRRNLRGRS